MHPASAGTNAVCQRGLTGNRSFTAIGVIFSAASASTACPAGVFRSSSLKPIAVVSRSRNPNRVSISNAALFADGVTRFAQTHATIVLTATSPPTTHQRT